MRFHVERWLFSLSPCPQSLQARPSSFRARTSSSAAGSTGPRGMARSRPSSCSMAAAACGAVTAWNRRPHTPAGRTLAQAGLPRAPGRQLRPSGRKGDLYPAQSSDHSRPRSPERRLRRLAMACGTAGRGRQPYPPPGLVEWRHGVLNTVKEGAPGPDGDRRLSRRPPRLRQHGAGRIRPEVRNPSSPTGWGATIGANPDARARPSSAPLPGSAITTVEPPVPRGTRVGLEGPFA